MFFSDLEKMYLDEISKIPLLTAEEEKELGRKILEGDKKAMDKLVYHNLRLVTFYAKKFVKMSKRPFLDICQDGNLGLIKAASKFDINKGTRFSTLATKWIYQSISRNSNLEEMIYKSDEKKWFYIKVKKVEKELAKTLYRDPTVSEIAKEMNKKEEEVKQVLIDFEEVYSLNALMTPEWEDADFNDFIEDPNGVNPEKIVLHEEIKEDAQRLLSTLTEQERMVIELRFGMKDGREKTLYECGGIMDKSWEWARKKEKKALEKMKKKYKKYNMDPSSSRKREISYIDIYAAFKDYDFSSFVSEYNELYNRLDGKSISLLYKFFLKHSSKDLTSSQLEKAFFDINKNILLKQKENRSSLKKESQLPFSFENTNAEEAIKMIRTFHLSLSQETKDTFLAFYQIPYRSLMTVEEKKQIAHILTPFYEEKEKRNKCQKKKVK